MKIKLETKDPELMKDPKVLRYLRHVEEEMGKKLTDKVLADIALGLPYILNPDGGIEFIYEHFNGRAA